MLPRTTGHWRPAEPTGGLLKEGQRLDAVRVIGKDGPSPVGVDHVLWLVRRTSETLHADRPVGPSGIHLTTMPNPTIDIRWVVNLLGCRRELFPSFRSLRDAGLLKEVLAIGHDNRGVVNRNARQVVTVPIVRVDQARREPPDRVWADRGHPEVVQIQ